MRVLWQNADYLSRKLHFSSKNQFTNEVYTWGFEVPARLVGGAIDASVHEAWLLCKQSSLERIVREMDLHMAAETKT